RSNLSLRAERYDDVQILGAPLDTFAAQARRELVRLAQHYTQQYLDLPTAVDKTAEPALILAGHQPQLFHAGVWYKNFVLSSVAAETALLAINLVVDNDTSRADTLRVPSGSHAAPRIEHVPLDASSPEIPYEERGVLDQALFGSFAERLSNTLAG